MKLPLAEFSSTFNCALAVLHWPRRGRIAVPVHIAHRDRGGGTRGEGLLGRKVPSPLPNSTLTVLLPIGHDQVGFAVAVNIANRHRSWETAGGEGLLGLERAVAIAQQHADRVAVSLVTAMSGLPSPFTSPSATESG